MDEGDWERMYGKTPTSNNTRTEMTELTPEAQAVVDAFYRELPPNYQQGGITAALRAAIDSVVPEEAEAPKAQFDCPPRKLYNFGKKEETWGYEHSDYMRRQFEQEKLDIRWEQRQQTRALMLAIVVELEEKLKRTSRVPFDTL
ncbi:MAG: hypothetical protein ACO3CQ_07810 [Candidatus Nanopelagicaceae bacterium]